MISVVSSFWFAVLCRVVRRGLRRGEQRLQLRELLLICSSSV